MQKNNAAEKLSELILEFTFYSFIGWMYETILTPVVWGCYADRGWLHLPICPIYGFCGIVLLLIFGRMKSIPLIFVCGTAVTTAAELAASYILEWFTNERLWDYDSWAFNFQGRISLGSSLVFGGMCVLLIKVLHPAAKKLFGKLGGVAVMIAAAIMLAVILADTVYTLKTSV